MLNTALAAADLTTLMIAGVALLLVYSKIPNASTNGGRRSMNCDGMASTNNFGKLHTNNSIPTDDEKTGHENEWADGILYTNILGFSVHNADSPGINKYSTGYQTVLSSILIVYKIKEQLIRYHHSNVALLL